MTRQQVSPAQTTDVRILEALFNTNHTPAEGCNKAIVPLEKFLARHSCCCPTPYQSSLLMKKIHFSNTSELTYKQAA
jgi:hypothetical protein